jgi:hypothetical protein
MPRRSRPDDANPEKEGALSAGHTEALLVRRADALRALAEAEAADDATAAGEARKQVQEAQLLLRRYGLE